jgi:LacI family transcriptional regulator
VIETSINQKLLASELNLSPATVSKSLRNHPGINAQTRARVMAAAAAKGYRLQPRRESVSDEFSPTASETVAVLLSEDRRTVGRDVPALGFLTGLSEQASHANVSLAVHRFSGDSRQLLDPATQPAALRAGYVRGAVLVHQFDLDVVAYLAQRMPVVTLIRDTPGVVKDHVDANHASAMYAIVKHLADLGHKRIGFVGRSPALRYSAARFGSFIQAMTSLGLDVAPRAMIRAFRETIPTEVIFDDSVVDAVMHAIKDDGVTAFACASDGVGYRLAAALAERGVSVPHDVSLTGFDGVDPTPGIRQLTSVATPFEQIGRAGFQMLRERMRDASLPSRSVLIECRFVRGETTAPPR